MDLNHDETSRWLRLSYCVTYRSAQGITAHDKRVMITSLDKPCFDVRSLIVGSSRVTAASLLYAPTREQEMELLARCPVVADPPVATREEVQSEEGESEDDE